MDDLIKIHIYPQGDLILIYPYLALRGLLSLFGTRDPVVSLDHGPCLSFFLDRLQDPLQSFRESVMSCSDSEIL